MAIEHFTLIVNGTECKSLQFSDEDSLFRGTSFPIDILSAKKSVTLDGLLTFSPQVAPYRKLGLQAEILLQDLPSSVVTLEHTLSPVQRRQLVIAIEPTYCPSAGYNAILVTSPSTTRSQFYAWRDILTNRLGLLVGYFSISIYGCLSPDFQLSSGATLRDEFREMLIVVLDESFRPKDSTDMNPSHMLPTGGMAQCSGFDLSTQWLFVASSEKSVEQLSAYQFTVPPNVVRSYNFVSEYFAAKEANLRKERSQGAITSLEILEEKIRVPAPSGNLARVATRVAKWLESRDVLRQYDLVTTTEGTMLGWIVVRRGYCRTANTVRILQHVERHETLLDTASILFSILASCPVSTQIHLFCNAVRSGKTDIVQCIRNVFVHSCLWDLSNFMKGKLDPKGSQFGESFPTLSALMASEEIEMLTREVHPSSHAGATADMIVNSVSALVAGLYWIVNSNDLRPWWCPWGRNHAIRRALLDLVNQITTKWGHAVKAVVVNNQKDKLEDVVTKHNRAERGTSGGVALRLIERTRRT